MSQQRSEKVALITGANKGIGFETARQLGEQGITVLVGSRNQHQGEQVASALQAKGMKAFLPLIQKAAAGRIVNVSSGVSGASACRRRPDAIACKVLSCSGIAA